MMERKILNKIKYFIFVVVVFMLFIIRINAESIIQKKIFLDFKYKIPLFLDKNSYYIDLDHDNIKISSNGEIYVLSYKYAKIYRFDNKGEFSKALFRKGKGPCELNYPKQFWFLSDNNLLLLNEGISQLKLIKSGDKYIEIKSFSAPYTDIGDLEEISSSIVCFLTAYSFIPKYFGNNNGKFLHIYNLKNQRNINDFFLIPKFKNKKSKILRGEYGTGDLLYFRNKLYIVYNQPGHLYIYDKNGGINSKISTKFPFVKYNSVKAKERRSNGNIQIRLEINQNCKMNFIKKAEKLFIITRINNRDEENPDYNFYLSEIDHKNLKIKNHKKINSKEIDITKMDYKCSYKNKIVFSDENYLYCFEIPV